MRLLYKNTVQSTRRGLLRINMHSFFVCLALVIVSNAKILALDARNNQTVVCCDRPSVVCNCNASPPGSNEAIQALEKKLDQLIALFNSSSPPTAEPTHPPGNECHLFVYAASTRR